MTQPNSRAFRHLMGCFPTGIAVVTTEDATLGAIGLTINSLTSVSLTPPLVLFCLDKKAHVHPVFKRSKIFAFNFLAEDQQLVSQYFANYLRHPKPKNLWDKPQQDCPLLRGTLGWALCRKVKSVAGGDHTIFIGEVIDLKQRKTSKAPLVYCQGQYRTLQE